MILTLIGTRGTGKSTVAAMLAQRLGWVAVDADHELELQAGRTIREIFAADGEPEFRRQERQILSELMRRNHIVLAAGGGAILNAETRSDFRSAGPVVWLQAAPETVAARIDQDPKSAEQRPPLTASGGIEEIRTILQAREPLYRETATLCVTTDGLTPAAVAEQILSQLPQLTTGSVSP